MIRCLRCAMAASSSRSFSLLMVAFSAGYAERQSSVLTQRCHTGCASRMNSPSMITAFSWDRTSWLLRIGSTEGCKGEFASSASFATSPCSRGMAKAVLSSAVSVDLPTEDGPTIQRATGRRWPEVAAWKFAARHAAWRSSSVSGRGVSAASSGRGDPMLDSSQRALLATAGGGAVEAVLPTPAPLVPASISSTHPSSPRRRQKAQPMHAAGSQRQ
mmetsp:Transcript_106864/g.297546  ORF Transcript_106864/g.297546 Transcript_106864/m.297546 type:complete len:216 (-) Transcript_106864:55-702(-)